MSRNRILSLLLCAVLLTAVIFLGHTAPGMDAVHAQEGATSTPTCTST